MDPEEMKRRGRGISHDMSPEAIARRIEIVGELYRTWLWLRRARRIGPVEGADQVGEWEPDYRGDAGRAS